MVPRASHCPFCILLLAHILLVSSDVFAQRSVPFRSPEDASVLAPKQQKELGKALAALRANQPTSARASLDAVYKSAPGNADANFLLGIYSAEMSDWVQAKNYWEKVLVLDPTHLNALLSLAQAFLRENKSAEAAPYLTRAVEAQPTSWRAHAVLADACVRQGLLDESIDHAERALALGHGQADIVQPILARALHLRGDRERALEILQAYAKAHLTDAAAAKQLENLQVLSAAGGEAAPGPASAALWPEPLLPAAALLSSNWLPPDIDDKMPSVEPGVACDLDDVLRKSGTRIQEFVTNVDQFTATEVVTHESINKWGFASRALKFEFEYLVSIKTNRLGLLAVDEQRNSRILSAKFPDGIVVTGLPALVLIFHPYYAQNFAISCEGLARSKTGPAWQLYFRQRPDKPNTIRTYQVGAGGQVYPAALKGRAWVAADTFHVVRLETDLIAPLPLIRLLADHAAIEYGQVHFRARNLDMWLPQNAEVHYDWRGRRGHRRHSFKNYLLFSVDDQQQITVPDAPAPPR